MAGVDKLKHVLSEGLAYELAGVEAMVQLAVATHVFLHGSDPLPQGLADAVAAIAEIKRDELPDTESTAIAAAVADLEA